MVWVLPGEALLLHDLLELSLVGEEERQVGGQDGVPNVPQDPLVLLRRQVLEDVMPVILRYGKWKEDYTLFVLIQEIMPVILIFRKNYHKEIFI